MFGTKKSSEVVSMAPVTDFDDPVIKATLSGNWLTLALSRLQTNYRSGYERHDWDEPSAQGVVHLDIGYDRVLRAELNISTQVSDPPRGQIGNAYLIGAREATSRQSYVLLKAAIADPGGKITAALQDSFNSAALSGSGWVHVRLRREKLDLEAVMTDLNEKKYGAHHHITEVNFMCETILSKAPIGSWAWMEK